MSAWHTMDDVCRHLRCSRDKLRERMLQTPWEIERPWVDMGTVRKPAYRFSNDLANVDRWWKEIHEWPQLDRGAENIKSDGVTPMDGSAPVSAPTKKPRSNSRRASPAAKSSESGGNLNDALKFLQSGQP